ncbi:hypothetical protein BGX38DRAFT_216576 [Terfezia claveryi]|nr:hypothetical protein BGX38DRAFT_216576 [Terfezia claveryi]
MDHEYVLAPRGLYSSAPAFRPTFLDHPTLLITYWCSLFSVFLIFSRLFWRFSRLSKAYKDDWWMVASIIPLGIRLGLAHLVLIWGTNNISLAGFDEFRKPRDGGEYVKWGLDEEIRRRENGSKCILAARVAYTAFIWSQKLCITEFHSKLNLSFWNTSYKGVLGTIRWTLVITFLGVVVSIFAECNPFQKHWQVFPDPGSQCRQGVAPLIVMAVCNAATDLLIVIFPLPPILIASIPLKRKFWLIVSLSLSLITCALAIYRVPFVLHYHTSQPHRTLYSSIECLASCAIANAIVLNSFARDKGPKRKRYRGPGGAHMLYSPEAIANRGRMRGQEQLYALDQQSTRLGMKVWGSDEDLVKGTGLGMNEDLRKMSYAAQRHSGLSATFVPNSSEMNLRGNAEGAHGYAPWVASWGDGVKTPPPVRKVGDGQFTDWENSPSRKVSFLDVGGLLSPDKKVNRQNQGSDSNHSGSHVHSL